MSVVQPLHRTAVVPSQFRLPPPGPLSMAPLSPTGRARSSTGACSPTAGATLPVLQSGSISPADSGVDSAGISGPGSPTMGVAGDWCISPLRTYGTGDAGAFTPISASPDAVPCPVEELERLWVTAAAGDTSPTPGTTLARLTYTDIYLAYRQITLAITFDAVLSQRSLRASLSKVLGQFPVLLCQADCKAASLSIPVGPAPGVALVAARTDLTADQLNQLQHSYAGQCQRLSPLYEAMPPSPWNSSLLTLKATHTSDAKTVIAVAMSHLVGDVQSLATFLQAWGRLGLGGPVIPTSNDRALGDTVGMASVPNTYDPAHLLGPGTMPARPQFCVVSWEIAAGTLAAIKHQAAEFAAAGGLDATAGGYPGAGCCWVSTNDVVSAISWVLQRRLHPGTDAKEFSFDCAFSLRGAGDVKPAGNGGVFGNCLVAAKTQPLTNRGAACADVYEAAFGIRRSISQLREGVVDDLIKARRSSSMMFEAEKERAAGGVHMLPSASPDSLEEETEAEQDQDNEDGARESPRAMGLTRAVIAAAVGEAAATMVILPALAADRTVASNGAGNGAGIVGGVEPGTVSDDGGDDGVIAQAIPRKRFSVTAWNSIPVGDLRFADGNGAAVGITRFEGSTVSCAGIEAPAPYGTRMRAYILPVLGDPHARRLQLLVPAWQAGEATRRLKLLLGTLCGDIRDPLAMLRDEL